MVRLHSGIPPILCAAKSKSTDKPCQRYAVPGATVCPSHGGSTRAVRDKADLRMSLSQLLRDEPRPPWQVLLEALAASDALMRDGLQTVSDAGENVTPDQLDRFVSSLERAAKLSKITLDANVGERRTRLLESQTKIMAGAVSAGLDAIFTTLVDRYNLDSQAELELRQAALHAAAEHAEAAGSTPGSTPGTKRWGNDERGDQRFLRTLGSTRKLQRGELQPGQPDDPQADDPQPQPDGPGSPPGSPASTHPARAVPSVRLVPDPPPSPLE